MTLPGHRRHASSASGHAYHSQLLGLASYRSRVRTPALAEADTQNNDGTLSEREIKEAYGIP